MGFLRKLVERMRTRNPWLSAVLNFFGWGVGYLYTGRKKFLGISMFGFVAINYLGATAYAYGSICQVGLLAISLSTWILVSFALARDAYLEARKRNEEGGG